jgi:hypothetical protein
MYWEFMYHILQKEIITTVILVSISFAANAQSGSFDSEYQDVPVDGGIILFAAAGAAYGYKKLR